MGTNFKQVDERVAALEAENARLASELEAVRARFAGIVDISDDAIISINRHQRITLFNQGAERIFGYWADEALGQPLDMLLPADFLEVHRRYVREFARSGDALRPMAARGEIRGRRKNGEEFPAEASISKFEIAGEPILNVRLRDISERRRAREELKARARQQAALAQFGLAALRKTALPELMQRACEMVAQALRVEYAKVLELLPGGEKLRLAAGVGWREGAVGNVEISAGSGSHAGYALASTEPVVIEDLRTETRFGEPFLAEHGVVSGLVVIIYAQGRPFGALGAHTGSKREFTENDISLLQVAANVLGAAIERERTEEALRESNETLRVINQASPLAIVALDLQRRVKFWNPAAERLFGWTEEEVLDRPVPTLPPGEEQEYQEMVQRILEGERLAGYETRRRNKNGDTLDIGIWSEPLRDAPGKITGTLSILVDLTERNRMEEQYRETQKLESIGVLAGGIAHDFNNLLTGIIGNISMAGEAIHASSSARRMLDNALHAGDRAAELIRQLLAYAGKGRFVIEPVDLSNTVQDLLALIETTVLKKVRLRLDLAQDLPPIDADPSQMQQLVMNLVINAAEAIPEDSGTVAIRTRLKEVAGDDDLPPGRYVALEVSDTGVGMDEEVKARIFEPFFTTKFTGRGLGLAAVSGIVRGYQGAIKVTSAPGRGSTFEVLLPASPREPARVAPERAPAGAVLVVDDEEVVRQIATLALSSRGFHILTAENGLEGVELFRQNADNISAVLLDMSMPVMSGERALREIRKIRPDARVIVSSGYSEAEAARRFAGLEVAGFVQKPYTATQLVDKIKSVIASQNP